jgi:predicted molibdopterin-dependent oxidoreductase YjgC
MATFVRFTLDGKPCLAEEGAQLVAAAKECGVYIPTLCNYPGIPPKGACRICTVLVNGIPQTACTTKVVEDMAVTTSTPELESFRKSVVEILFAEGNHLCPSCERSGNCELQALAYRYRVTVPHFPYLFPKRDVEAWHPKLVKDHNRCIQCKRCIRGIHKSRRARRSSPSASAATRSSSTSTAKPRGTSPTSWRSRRWTSARSARFCGRASTSTCPSGGAPTTTPSASEPGKEGA